MIKFRTKKDCTEDILASSSYSRIAIYYTDDDSLNTFAPIGEVIDIEDIEAYYVVTSGKSSINDNIYYTSALSDLKEVAALHSAYVPPDKPAAYEWNAPEKILIYVLGIISVVFVLIYMLQ